MIQRADEVLAQGDLEQVVDYAIDLSRRKVEIDGELDKAKAYLREAAKKQSRGAFEVELLGLTGSVTVKFPGLILKEKKGADLKDLEVNLPPEVFASLFRRTIVIVPAEAAEEFLEALGKVSLAHQATIKHFIEVVERTPAVYLPK